MITVRKLFSLKKGTRERKIIRILGEWELGLHKGINPDLLYLKEFLNAVEEEEALRLPENPVNSIRNLLTETADVSSLLILVNRMRHIFMSYLDIAPADWDLLNPEDGRAGERQSFPCSIYLDELRSPFNVGSVFRTAECLGISNIYISPGTADPDHPRAVRTAMGCTQRIPWRRMNYSELAAMDESIFAMELGGESIADFSFPRKGILVLGSEELGVSPECIALAEQTGGIVSIDLYGNKASLNVSVAFGIVMNAWASSLSMV
ncbi:MULTISPECIES: TrmH family RNA methyltransferase [unclassified Oceanispirochaeta]|uniref:TrmH family RNA methyltransferase n=1 Tax=unclassified Oceanispirochaeta TaxID=2635722 RepID=UPI000E093E4E|nr:MULTISPECIES: TrmH family RNA methyltransferase [unclassified Oceanispirochaeta]MBF9015388.1 TrmH family RNA methyltransferase [Oceanispirochaeta sp. M2]NPD71847.1 TrmH family RNA methyltransferase [Oceanispirochaeta sp. M1]RDG32657.1 TrmH family RNA methyltransferase [Oceanispirochaeta sp. M1]